MHCLFIVIIIMTTTHLTQVINFMPESFGVDNRSDTEDQAKRRRQAQEILPGGVLPTHDVAVTCQGQVLQYNFESTQIIHFNFFNSKIILYVHYFLWFQKPFNHILLYNYLKVFTPLFYILEYAWPRLLKRSEDLSFWGTALQMVPVQKPARIQASPRLRPVQ